VDLWFEVLKCYSKFGALSWICSKKVSSTRKKMELVQISIQMQVYIVGERANALPSTPDESVFKQD
jgi:hypothetical protein